MIEDEFIQIKDEYTMKRDENKKKVGDSELKLRNSYSVAYGISTVSLKTSINECPLRRWEKNGRKGKMVQAAGHFMKN